MIKACVFLIFFWFIVSSCSSWEWNKLVPDTTQYLSWTIQDVPMANSWIDNLIVETPSNISITDSFQMKIPSVESIKQVTTLSELKLLNPMLADSSWTHEQQFIELQKYRMIFGILLNQIKDPEFLKIRTEENDIILWKEIWPQDLKDIDQEFENIILQSSYSWWNASIINNIAKRRMDTMTEFQSSQKYKDYIQLNQEKIHTMNTSMKKFWTSEMLETDKKIQDMENNSHN